MSISKAARIWVAEATSTMDIARHLVSTGVQDIPRVVTAYQSVGRGRRGSAWTAPEGTCLLTTLILSGDDCKPGRVHQLSFVAGVAAVLAIHDVTGLGAGLKWPNDVVVSGKKVAGLLIETASWPDGTPVALLGVGINVNVVDFPAELSITATSLTIEAERTFDLNLLERSLCEHVDAARECASENGWKWVIGEWRKLDVSEGRRYGVLEADGEMIGTAAGVADDGSLILKLDDGRQITTLAATSRFGSH